MEGKVFYQFLKRIVLLIIHCKKSDFLFVKSTGEMLRVKSEVYFLM